MPIDAGPLPAGLVAADVFWPRNQEEVGKRPRADALLRPRIRHQAEQRRLVLVEPHRSIVATFQNGESGPSSASGSSQEDRPQDAAARSASD